MMEWHRSRRRRPRLRREARVTFIFHSVPVLASATRAPPGRQGYREMKYDSTTENAENLARQSRNRKKGHHGCH